MKKSVTVVLLLLVIVSGAAASSALALRAGLGIVHFSHSESEGGKTVSSGSNGLHFQADWDIFMTENTAFNLQADLDVGRKSYINGTNLTSQAGYGIRAGFDYNLEFLRLGAGIRWQAFYAGDKGEIGSVSGLLVSLNADLVFDTLILGIEYAYPLKAWIKESGKDSRELSLDRVLFDTGAFFAYAGVRCTF